MHSLFLNNGSAPTIDWSFLGGSLPSIANFSRATSGYRTNKDGALENVASGAPRFDYHPTSRAALGLLMEGQRTNIFLNSDTPATQNVTVGATLYTLSFYGTGTITRSGASSGTTVGTGGYPVRTTENFTPSAGALTLTISGDVQKVQLEAGSRASAYIPTGASAATRAKDILTVSSIPWFNQKQGTFVVEYDGKFINRDVKAIATFYGGGFTQNSIHTGLNGYSSGRPVSGSYLAGVLQLNAAETAPFVEGQVYKQAVSYQAGSFRGAYNGMLFTEVTSFSVPVVTSLAFGAELFEGGTSSSHLRRFMYWPRALSNAELQRVAAL